MNGVLNIDTDACEQYAKQLDEVQDCYQTVAGWASINALQLKKVLRDITKFVAKKGAEAAASTFLGGLPGAVVAGADFISTVADITCKLNSFMECIALVQSDMGDKCIIRLKNHFRETASNMTMVEKTVCNRGEKLFDL